MSITKRKGKNKTVYYTQVYVRGVRMKSKSFPTKTEAVLWEQKEKQKFLQGTNFLAEERDEIFFEDCVRRYLKEYVVFLRPASQKKIQDICQKFLLNSPLARVRMSNLHHISIDNWIEWLFKYHRGKNQRYSFKMELRRLGSVLHWWRNYIDPGFSFPIVQGHRNRCYQHQKPSKIKRPDYFAKPEEIRKWLSELEKISNPVYYCLAQFMILTGARVGEGLRSYVERS